MTGSFTMQEAKNIEQLKTPELGSKLILRGITEYKKARTLPLRNGLILLLQNNPFLSRKRSLTGKTVVNKLVIEMSQTDRRRGEEFRKTYYEFWYLTLQKK